jgi:hypothetical protein
MHDEQKNAKVNQNENAPQSEADSPISQLFQRVVMDKEFKNLLIENPDKALAGYELSEAQVIMIKNLDREDIDKLTPENLEEFFSADAAVYTPDETDAMTEDAYSEEDFEDFDDEYEEDEDEDI